MSTAKSLTSLDTKALVARADQAALAELTRRRSARAARKPEGHWSLLNLDRAIAQVEQALAPAKPAKKPRVKRAAGSSKAKPAPAKADGQVAIAQALDGISAAIVRIDQRLGAVEAKVGL